MATKKREIYARAAVQLRTHDRPREAERRCPGAMGLYLFLLLQARGEQTDGDVSESAALESWSAPTTYRRKQLIALVAVGLVEVRDDRLHVVKYEEHNDTKGDILEARAAATKRQRTRRGHGDVTRDKRVTANDCHADVPYSISYSPSGSGSLGGAGGATAPDWWAGAIATAEQAVGGTIDQSHARWLEYDASRERKGWARNHRDAVGWLTTVMRTERDRQRSGPPKSGAEVTRQPYDPDAPWIKLGDTGS